MESIFFYSHITLVAQSHSMIDSYTHIFLPLCHFWLIMSPLKAEIPSSSVHDLVLLNYYIRSHLHYCTYEGHTICSSSFSSHSLSLAVLHPHCNTVPVFGRRFLFSQDSLFLVTGKKKMGDKKQYMQNTRWMPISIIPLPFFHPCETSTSHLLLRCFRIIPSWLGC